ncbi:efflux RND transporter periplasmic adaptor subunit [Muricoccus pecuniae]|jgi:cobalt-zinc-cadmium efflux system membrane fusion protein|uniref:Cobalt-zinc-cadmium efflux system membrane fusion protein n=2 Tax=Roseomonadaceae TaxID=3385906 RepID=A0A840YHH5_9PROT|nr:efflux RND transporter periplasmic adaptor subunit [Roseomonas pecuniae]MBB5695897.1 cobalt-zinc-cadmium efflux system membrane fusion protein [Roseomonas pecuniae]
MLRMTLLAGAAIGGLALSVAYPSIPETARSLLGMQSTATGAARAAAPAAAPKGDGHGHAEGEEHGEEGRIKMTAEQVEAAGIRVAAVQGGVLVTRAAVPGVLAASQDRQARVTARLGGIVAEVRKTLGEEVARGDILAVLESREVADAKGEFMAATRAAALAETTLARETRLWRQKISAEQEFLQARTAAEEARIKVDLGRARLAALGLSDAEVAALARQPAATLRRLELRAPMAGRVTARNAVLGASVAADAEVFAVADLSVLWVELTIPPRDLPMARQGQTVLVTGEGEARTEGKIVFLSPVLDPETRSARAVAEIANPEGVWRAGGFVTAHLSTAEQQVDALVPRDAVQEVEGKKVVFVRNEEGFELREVETGREDANGYEVIFGLDQGTEIAVANAFSLRAELSKSEAGHAH